jgi:hypothetical protein
MRPMIRWMFVVAGLAGTAGLAAADPEPIRLTYAAPPECPGEAEVVAELAQHADVQRVDSLTARAFMLVIARDDAGFHGELSVHDGGEAPAARDVHGGTCEEVVTALVLVTALAIQERTAPPPAAPPAVPSAPAPPPPEPGLRLAAGAGVARYSGVTPSARIGVPVFLAAIRGHQQLRVTFDTTASDDVAMASFRWTAGRVEGCPYTWQISRVAAAPCAGLQLGALTGSGTATAQASSGTRPWIAPEVVARVDVQLGRVAIGAEGTAAAPLVRDRYYIAPATTIHQVPAVSYSVGTSVGIAFR